MNGLKDLNFFFVEEPIIRNLSLYDNIKNYKIIASGEHLHNLTKQKMDILQKCEVFSI